MPHFRIIFGKGHRHADAALAKSAGDHGTRDPVYTQLRQEFMNDPELKALLPQFVRQSHRLFC